MNSIGLYIHIPFCMKKCNYCDFLSFDHSNGRQYKDYVTSLKGEIAQYGEVYGNKFIANSIFIGGGTPSLLEERLIADILTTVRSAFLLTNDAEVTIETNPKTLTEEKLKSYITCGINRLSIGAQSFDDTVLQLLGRVHNADDIYHTFAMARKQGYENISLDLMFAVPTHTTAIWKDTLAKAVKLSPEHLSFYSLQLEEGTNFFAQFQKGALEQISDEADREMYREAVATLIAAGYEQYEISNCAKPGFECRHNLKYWSMESYLGLGLGAHSFVNGIRFSNTRNLQLYMNSFKDDHAPFLCEKIHGENENPDFFLCKSVDWFYKNSMMDFISEYVFTGLRKTKGIDLADFSRRFGKDLFEIYEEQRPKLEQYIKNGYLILEADEHLRFSLAGIDISNAILTEFV